MVKIFNFEDFHPTFYFHPLKFGGRWTHFDYHVFRMGWFNHQHPKLLRISSPPRIQVILDVKLAISRCYIKFQAWKFSGGEKTDPLKRKQTVGCLGDGGGKLLRNPLGYRWLGGGFKYFLFSSRNLIQFDLLVQFHLLAGDGTDFNLSYFHTEGVFVALPLIARLGVKKKFD